MKVLVNAVAAKSGGAVTYIGNLARELASLNQGHHYLFYVLPERANALQGLGHNVSAVPTRVGRRPSWQRLLWDQLVWRRTIKKEKADILVSSNDFGVLFPSCRQILMIRNPFDQTDFLYQP